MKPEYVPHGEEQILGYLVEEAGEVLAGVGKTQRWGLDSYNPELPHAERELNGYWILRELLDLERAIRFARELLDEKGFIEEPETGEEGRIANSGPITIPSVIASVERFYHVEPGRLSSRSRVRTLLGPRQVAMYLCRQNTIASHAEIGRAFNREHPAVVNATRKISETKDLQLIQHVAEIQREFDSIPCEGKP